MDSSSQEALEKPAGSGTIAPTRKSILLLIGAIVSTVLLVTGSVSYAIWHENNSLYANNQQWCTALDILTKVPVARPSDPKANPSRVFSYNLYESFRSIEMEFRCQP